MPIHFTFQAILGFVRCRVSDVASVPSGKDDGVVQYHRNVDLAIDMVTKYCTYLKIKTVEFIKEHCPLRPLSSFFLLILPEFSNCKILCCNSD